MRPSSVLSRVRSFPLFAALDEAEKDKLIQAGKLRHCYSGQHLFVFGDPVQHFYIICDGALQLFRETPDGHEMTADVLIAGDCVGETDLLRPGLTHQFNALAIKETTLLAFPLDWLKDNAQKNGALAMNLLRILANRLHIATMEAEHKNTMTAAQQVACFLERLCVLHNFDPHGFDLPYSKTLIASRLGMELETFSRALTKVRQHGISLQGTRCAFLDLQKTEQFSCRDCSLIGHCHEHEQLKEYIQQGKTAPEQIKVRKRRTKPSHTGTN